MNRQKERHKDEQQRAPETQDHLKICRQKLSKLHDKMARKDQELKTVTEQLSEFQAEAEIIRDAQLSQLTELFEQELLALEEKSKNSQRQEETSIKEQERATALLTQLTMCKGELTTKEKQLQRCQEQERLLEKQYQQQVSKLQVRLRNTEQDLSMTKELLVEFQQREERFKEVHYRVTELQDQLETNNRDFKRQSKQFREDQQLVTDLEETLTRKERELTNLQIQLQENNSEKASLLEQLRQEQQRAGELQSRVTANTSEFQGQNMGTLGRGTTTSH